MLEIDHSVIHCRHWCAMTHVVNAVESEGMRQDILDKVLDNSTLRDERLRDIQVLCPQL
jgi:hypothetical protein